jgi:hypothetical protein
MASEENKEKEASALMQNVFQYAEDRGTKVIFALDFDTWMSNPRNIIEKLPKEAVFELIGGHITPNPDHPEGYKYFKQVLKSLLEMYPQIDQLSVWHRRPGTRAGLGSIWMSFPYEKFPENWKIEYRQKLKDHPEIEDNLMASGTFAYGKLISALQKARDEIKSDLVISSGSWRFEYVPYADAMYPKDVPLLPLDWMVIFETPEAKRILANAGKNREMYPVIWAHHDDHRYIGRPYTPWERLPEMLEERNSQGFGIIHWTTHPLDLYFSSSAHQVWENTANESIKITIENYVQTNFGADTEQLSDYYYKWLTEGPMFGRETSDHFVDLGKQGLGHKLESWEEMRDKAGERLQLLNNIPLVQKNNYLRYQKAMEQFYVSFFENQILFQDAFELLRNSEKDKAKEIIAKANPDESIQKYTDATKLVGFTSGEKAMVFSMNTRWKADFINLKQVLGMDPVRYKFAPTQHDPLAQAPGHYTYFIDEEGKWWRSLWEHELPDESFVRSNQETFLEVINEFEFDLRSIHNQPLLDGEYKLVLYFTAENPDVKIKIFEEGKVIGEVEGTKIQFKASTVHLKLQIIARNGKVGLKSMEVLPV